jgi:molecular chaperone DnaK (HSP70)
VARGAAIHAGIVAAKSAYGKLELDEDVRSDLEEQVVFNVNAYSLGVEALRRDKEISSVLIPKNTQLPHAASKIYRLHQAGATAVAVRVLEGEATAAAHNILIGTCLVKNLPANLRPKLPSRSAWPIRPTAGSTSWRWT